MRAEHQVDLFTALAISGGTPDPALADVLYSQWFTRWRPPAPPRGDGPDVVALARAAHAASETFESGWVALSLAPHGHVAASRGGEQRLLAPGDYANLSRPAAPVRPGHLLAITARRDSADLEGGWWYTWGSQAGEPGDQGRLLRLYWHVEAQAIAPVVGAITAALEAAAVPYLLKCPVHHGLFGRADALVVYVALTDWPAIQERLREAHGRVERWLNPAVPPLTLKLGQGVAAAEDPGRAVSYGQSRSRAVAEGISAIRAGACADKAVILELFQDALRRHQIDPQRPFQQLGSPELAPW